MMKITVASLALAALGPFSSCADLRELVLGVDPIEERPFVATPAPAPSKVLAADPDPRLTIKLPGGGEASYEYAQAKLLMSRGQLTAGSFVLTPKALGPSGTEDELALLADLCTRREDPECVAQVEAHRKGLRGGAGSIDSLKKLAKKSPESARALLMLQLEAGTITSEQVAVLADACRALKDKPCESMLAAMQ